MMSRVSVYVNTDPCCAHAEHKNGVNFPDDESIAVSVPMWKTYNFHSLLHTQNTAELNIAVCVWVVCVPCSRLALFVQSRISAPRREAALWNRHPPRGVLIPQSSLLYHPDLCSPVKVTAVCECGCVCEEEKKMFGMEISKAYSSSGKQTLTIALVHVKTA